ncbi:VOC family protein [Amycolatopsis alkalitolerans]|uniref:VOC family protein n=1 Tax=Amycolatopsis alkalitolerans TaxID=2547244 RepID=A0A5C4LXK5_9PSEU|nr:VOC family protein [Amycolatopsis alkalitolerans]TNC24332.1 VOC family protein [Amycolatopsis alkalitolerans]
MTDKALTTCLWFDGNGEEAANFYASVFDDAKIGRIGRYVEGEHGTPGAVMVVEFELNGQKFIALNGGPQFKFNEAVSFQIPCENQEEVDYYWAKLTADGGEEGPCGWLKDKFGLSWQVVPNRVIELIGDADTVKAARATEAMYAMKKLDIAAIEKAHAG